MLFASALEIHLHRGQGPVYSAAGAPIATVDLGPAERAALDAPRKAGVWVDLAEAYAGAGRMEDATRAFSHARAIQPNHPKVRNPPDWASSGDVTDVERAVLLDPSNDEAWGTAAGVLATMGQNERAITYYLRALELDPSDSEWPSKLMALGPDPRIDRFMGDWMVSAGDADDEALGDMADAMKAAGSWPQACALYQKAFEADPNDSEWTGALDECARRFPGEYRSAAEAAVEAYERQIAASPRDDEIIGDYADALRTLGREAEACTQYQRAASIDPSDSEWIQGLVACPGHMMNVGAMRAQIGSDDEALGDLADALRANGRTADACQLYADAARLDPADDEWREALRSCR
ncbi:MAG: tetratricopeptide repeat protein [Proteobacteria bacterium]|nr:tetratricopeptide repeat protein [Pseudomonadota bacterium]